MTYFHPRDFDPAQPRMKDLSLSRTFKSYVGLSKTENKLKEILKAHQFTTVNELEKTINWEATHELSLGSADL